MAFVKLMFIKLWADRNLRYNSNTRDLFKGGTFAVELPKSAVSFSTHWIEQREAEGAVNPIDSIFFDRLRDEIEKEIQLRKKKRVFDKAERIGPAPGYRERCCA